MPNYKNIEEIKDKTHKEFTKSLKKKGFTDFSTGIIKNKNNKIKFLEVIINNRNQRYKDPSIMKKIPKTFRGIKVKSF